MACKFVKNTKSCVLAVALLVACSCTSKTEEAKTGESKTAQGETEKGKPAEGKKVVGYLYTTTNGEGINEAVRLARYEDGTVGDERTYSTTVKGGSDHTAPALGDYDAQGQTQIIDGYLLTANIGARSVSVFKIDRPTGELTLVGNTDSHGEKPVTIGYTPVVGEENAYWVAVGNQWNQPTVLYDGDKQVRYPNDKFYKIDLTKPDASDKDRSIELFRLNTTDGKLTHVRTIDQYNRRNGGAAQVLFSPNGKKLAVTTWGVPHFLTEDPKLKEMRPSRVYVYDFDNGNTTNRRHYEEDGIAGTTGFEWAANNEIIYASNFNLLNAKGDHGLTVLKDMKKTVKKIGNWTTGQVKPKDIDEACWTAMSPEKDMLYVVSYVTNVITPFKVNPVSGEILARMPLIPRGEGFNPLNDAKDLLITPDGQHMYWLGSFESYSVNMYDLNGDGTAKYKGQYTLEATKHAVGKPGVYDLAGIAGYDL